MGMLIMPATISCTMLAMAFSIVALTTKKWSSFDRTSTGNVVTERYHSGLFRVCDSDDICTDITGDALTDELKATIGTLLVSLILGFLSWLVLMAHCVVVVMQRSQNVFYLPIMATVGNGLACIFALVAVVVYDFEVHREITNVTSVSRGFSLWFGVASAAVFGVATGFCLLEQLIGQVKGVPKDEKHKHKKSKSKKEKLDQTQQKSPYIVYSSKGWGH